MRQLSQEQLTLTSPTVNHRHAQELKEVDRILKANPGITELALQDLQRHCQLKAGPPRLL